MDETAIIAYFDELREEIDPYGDPLDLLILLADDNADEETTERALSAFVRERPEWMN